MKRIQKGASEQIFLTARDENGNVAKEELSSLILDIVIAQKTDETKYIHITSNEIQSNEEEGYVSFVLSDQDTASIDGIASLELRGQNGTIATKQNAFLFEDNVIHTIDIL